MPRLLIAMRDNTKFRSLTDNIVRAHRRIILCESKIDKMSDRCHAGCVIDNNIRSLFTPRIIADGIVLAVNFDRITVTFLAVLPILRQHKRKGLIACDLTIRGSVRSPMVRGRVSCLILDDVRDNDIPVFSRLSAVIRDDNTFLVLLVFLLLIRFISIGNIGKCKLVIRRILVMCNHIQSQFIGNCRHIFTLNHNLNLIDLLIRSIQGQIRLSFGYGRAGLRLAVYVLPEVITFKGINTLI